MNFKNKVVVVDYGSQTTQLILRRIREFGVYCEVVEAKTTSSEIIKKKPKALILSGGPSSAFEKASPRLDKNFLKLDIPILGICYGMQLICHLMGSKVRKGRIKEFGKAKIRILFNLINQSTKEKIF